MKKYQVWKKSSIYSNDWQLVGTYTSRNRANNKSNKLDEDYGAYISFVKMIIE